MGPPSRIAGVLLKGGNVHPALHSRRTCVKMGQRPGDGAAAQDLQRHRQTPEAGKEARRRRSRTEARRRRSRTAVAGTNRASTLTSAFSPPLQGDLVTQHFATAAPGH